MSTRVDLFLFIPNTFTGEERDRIEDEYCRALDAVMLKRGGNLQVAVVPASVASEFGERLPLLPEGAFYRTTHSWRGPEDVDPKKAAKAPKAQKALPEKTSSPPPDLLTCPGAPDGLHTVMWLNGGMVKCFPCGRAWVGGEAARVWNSADASHRQEYEP